MLAAKTTLLNRVNEVYNDDLAIKFVLVAGTDTKLNFNTRRADDGNERAVRRHTRLLQAGLAACAGAPWTATSSCSASSSARRTTTSATSASASTAAASPALGVGRRRLFKAGRLHRPADPTGDFYAIDYVAHEMGHQMEATTRSTRRWDCSPATATALTPVEPGSGSSIHGLRGHLCLADNLQPHSDPYFSLRQRRPDRRHRPRPRRPPRTSSRSSTSPASRPRRAVHVCPARGCPSDASHSARQRVTPTAPP